MNVIKNPRPVKIHWVNILSWKERPIGPTLEKVAREQDTQCTVIRGVHDLEDIERDYAYKHLSGVAGLAGFSLSSEVRTIGKIKNA